MADLPTTRTHIGNGYYLVPITTEAGMIEEGTVMDNCVKDPGKISLMRNGTHAFYSLQDAQGNRIGSVVFQRRATPRGGPPLLFDARMMSNAPPDQPFADTLLNYMQRNRIGLAANNLDTQIGFFQLSRLRRADGTIIWTDQPNESHQGRPIPQVQGEVLETRIFHENNLPRDYHAIGGLFLMGHNIQQLPEGFFVHGDLDLRNTPIRDLPANLVVIGDLTLSGTQIRQLPPGLIVHGNLNITDAPLTLGGIPRDTHVGGQVYYSRNIGGGRSRSATVRGSDLRSAVDNYLRTHPDERPPGWVDPRNQRGSGGPGRGGPTTMSFTGEDVARGVIDVAESAVRILAWPVNLGFFAVETTVTAVTWYAMHEQIEDLIRRGAISQQEAEQMAALANTFGAMGMLNSAIDVIPGGKYARQVDTIARVAGITTALSELSTEDRFRQMVQDATDRMEGRMSQGLTAAQARQEFNQNVDASIAQMREMRDQAANKTIDFTGNPDPEYFEHSWAGYLGYDRYTYTSRDPRGLLAKYPLRGEGDPPLPPPANPAQDVLQQMMQRPEMRDLLERDPQAFLDQLNEALEQAQARVPEQQLRLQQYWDRNIQNMERFRGDTLREFDRRMQQRGIAIPAPAPVSDLQTEPTPITQDVAYNQPGGTDVIPTTGGAPAPAAAPVRRV